MCTIVAREASASRLCVVERHCRWRPHIYIVAVGAIVRRLEMDTQVLASDGLRRRGMRPIMAGETCARGKAMVHGSGNPGNKIVVAILACVLRQYVCLALAKGINVVVACQTSRHTGLCVVECGDRFPGCSCMAAVTCVGRGQMLAGDRQLAGGIGAIVARNARRRANVGMVESGFPGCE